MNMNRKKEGVRKLERSKVRLNTVRESVREFERSKMRMGAGGRERGVVGGIALCIMAVLAVLALGLLGSAQGDRFASTRSRNRTEAFYVADGGLQTVISSLKTNASNVVRATFPVLPGLLINASDWGFTAADFPGGITFNNMAGGQFVPNDPTSNVVVTVPGIGRGTARVTVWLKSVGATVADPVVFGVTSAGTLPAGSTRTVLADVTLVARGGRPPNPLQTGGLDGPVLNLLMAGGMNIGGTTLDGGATVAILKRVGNNWQQIGMAVAANAPPGGPYGFTFNLAAALARGETFSAKAQANPGDPWSPLAFPAVVE